MGKFPLLSGSQFQVSRAYDGAAWGPCGLSPPTLSPQPSSTPEPFLPTPRGSLGTAVTLVFPCLPARRALAPIGGGAGAWKTVPQPDNLYPEGA